MGKQIKQTFSNPIRGLTAIGTMGTSELARKIGGPIGALAALPENVGKKFGIGSTRVGSAPTVAGGQSAIEMLTQSGGAPLLSNIALGGNIDDALAGYLGVRDAAALKYALDGHVYETEFDPGDIEKIQVVRKQLQSIQQNRELRQQAVDKVIADFPNIAKQAAQARMQAGEEFDSVTKGYMDQALKGTAAKFAAGGGLSSGAMNEAIARVGAEQGMQRLGFQGEREQFAYGQGLNEYQNRLAEVNALRDFQNTMLGGGIQQGFSAQQANLQRQFQGQMANAEMANQRSLADQQSKNAMLGALGGLAGSILGPVGTAFGSQIAGSMFGSPRPRINTPNPRGAGGSFGPGFDTSSYAPFSVRGY